MFVKQGILALTVTVLGFALQLSQVAAQESVASQKRQVFSIPQTGLNFLTGDTWIQNNQKLRLYGVQSCIRGTYYTDGAGQKQDCGAVSLSMFAAFIRDTRPTCSPIAQIPAGTGETLPTILVVCSAHIGTQTIDLGTALITQGFAFAALTNNGSPVYIPYAVAEASARQAGAGLWAHKDMPHPNILIFKAITSVGN